MELINPKLTIQNTDQSWWLVRMEHRVSESEHIDVQLMVPRSTAESAARLQQRLLLQTQALLQAMVDTLARGTPDGG